MTEDGPAGPRSEGFLSTVRHLADRITAQPLLFGLALAVVVTLLVSLLVWGLDPFGVLVVGLTALLVLLLLGVVSLRAVRSTPEPLPSPAPPPSGAPVPELVIADDGHFVGGDDIVGERLVDLLDVPAADRAVRVRARLLKDASFRRRHPDQFRQLRRCVRSYELSLGRLLRGSVHYYWKWTVPDLAGSVLELRSIELPAQYGREWWFVWPADNPGQVLPVGLDEANVRSIRTGVYRWGNGGFSGIPGMPPDEPIWLTQIFPTEVWTCVVPAVVAHRSAEHPGPQDPLVLDITGWVLSDREPTKLVRTRPSEESGGWKPSDWSW